MTIQQGPEVADAASAISVATAAALKNGPPVLMTIKGILDWPWDRITYIATFLWILAQFCGYLWDRFYVRRKEAKAFLADLTREDEHV